MCNAATRAYTCKAISIEEFTQLESEILQTLREGFAKAAETNTNTMRKLTCVLVPNGEFVKHWYDGGGTWFYSNWERRRDALEGRIDYVPR